jgi:hypothetical protein
MRIQTRNPGRAYKILSFCNLQGATEKVMELVQSDAGLKFINASNAISYMPLLDHYANKG